MKNTQRNKIMSAAIWLIVLASGTGLLVLAQTPTPQMNEIRELAAGQTLEREMTGAETHRYKFNLERDKFFQVRVEQKGVDVALKLFDSSGKTLATMDSPNSKEGPETLSFIAEKADNFILEISGFDTKAEKGIYIIKREASRKFDANDQRRMKVEKLLVEGIMARDSEGQSEIAIKKLEEALQGWRELNDDYLIQLTTQQIVQIKQTKADQIFAEARELVNEGTAESMVVSILRFEEARKIFSEIGNKQDEAYCLGWLGNIYNSLGEKPKALEFYNQALLLFRQVGDKSGEASALNGIGLVYNSLGENQKALEFYNQAMPLRKQVSDKKGEADTLNYIGLLYDSLGEKQRALGYYNQALPLTRQVGDKSGEATTLNNIGRVYDDLGEEQKALEYYNQALPLFRQIGDKSREARTLNNIGGVYFSLGEKQKALGFLNQVLPFFRQIGEKSAEANTLNNIGVIYDLLSEKQKALDYYNQALLLRKQVGDKRGEATTLNNIGAVYKDLGEKHKALEYFQASLPLSRAVGDKSQQSNTLDWLMVYWKGANNSRFAVFYGKQSVNLLQKLRVNIQELDKETQKTFLKTIEYTYRNLAEIMIAEGRLSEAQQILNSFRDQQFFDFDQAQVKQSAPLNLTPREADFISLYERTSGRVGEIGEQSEELKRTIGNRQPTAEENVRVQKLETDLKTASGEFLAVLKRAEAEFSQKPDAKDKVGEVPDLKQMQTALEELNRQTGQKAATVYHLVGEENFSVIVITADDIKSVSTPVKNSVLNARALDFWALLQSPVYNPNLVGKELYDVVFKPLESVLPKDTRTILWALDGNLRYVPMAALFDGKQYLAERYNHVNFTRADKERMTRAVKPVWTAIGLGTSEAKTVELLGSRIFFDALPGVGEELKMLFRQKDVSGGIFDGETWRDAKFTRQAMLDALKQKRPLVHIASHFSFRPGDEARSFLLLGDGSAFTLEEMKSKSNLFEGVELLTLSACNTAAQQSGANGREIDGFAELAQRLGANSVMATLWAVADCSTPWLMREFYDLKLTKNQNKAESLRQAQLALLSGKAGIKPCGIRTDLSPIKIVIIEKPQDRKPQTDTTRSDIIYLDKKDAPVWDKEKHPPFAHPYYWSPFVLFGNWR